MKITNTKDKIVEAAVNIFAQKGYTETSMREIADAVNVSAASLYNHFPSKMAILEHIIDLYDAFANDNVMDLDHMIETMDARSVLRAVFFRFPEDEHNLHAQILKIIFQEQYRNERLHQYMRDSFFTALHMIIKTVLDKLAEKGKIQPLDSVRFAKIINYIAVASAVEFCHYTADEYAAARPITQFELLELIIDIIVDRAL